MRSLRYLLAAAITATMLSGCSDGGGSGSNLDDQITLPDDSDVPDNPVEEEEGDGTDSSETGFSDRRFWVEGDQDTDLENPGLKAADEDNKSNADQVDPEALPERQLFTIPEVYNSDGEGDRLGPTGVFYRTSNEFRFAPVSYDGTDEPPRVSDEDPGASCIGDQAFDTSDAEKTAISYNLERDGDGDCPSLFADETQWKQVLIGAGESSAPDEFDPDHVPVVGLNAMADPERPAQWLVLDRTDPDNLKMARLDADGLQNPDEVDQDGISGSLEEVHRLAALGPDSLILAYGRSDDEDTSGTDETEYRLAHYDRETNTLTDLEAGDSLPDTLSRLPLDQWITTSGDQAFIAIGDALLAVDDTSYTLLDSVAGSGRPYFVTASDSHVVWSARSSEDDGNLKQVRVVSQGASDGGSILVRAPYVESRVRGTANGWIYFTVARDITEKGRLETGFAVGLNPAQSADNAFLLEDAQWIGGSVQPSPDLAPQDLDTADINNLFYRGGSDNTMRNVRAVENPRDPIKSRDGNLRLPIVTLGTLPERFTTLFMNDGFGPQRLLTAVEVSEGESIEGEDELDPRSAPSAINRIYYLNPQTPGSLEWVSEEDGSLVRALPLF